MQLERPFGNLGATIDMVTLACTANLFTAEDRKVTSSEAAAFDLHSLSLAIIAACLNLSLHQ